VTVKKGNEGKGTSPEREETICRARENLKNFVSRSLGEENYARPEGEKRHAPEKKKPVGE